VAISIEQEIGLIQAALDALQKGDVAGAIVLLQEYASAID